VWEEQFEKCRVKDNTKYGEWKKLNGKNQKGLKGGGRKKFRLKKSPNLTFIFVTFKLHFYKNQSR
jgi:hypothetical protein